MNRIPTNSELLTRTRERAGQESLAWVGRFTNLSDWLEKVTA